MPGIVVKPRARILHGHDWVFSSEVLKVFGKPADGDVISLKDGKDHLIGSAIYNSKSQIVARRFSRRKQDLDLDFFKRRITQAAEYRARRGIDPRLCRVVWSESDGLPGLIIDRYGDCFVMQTLTLAMDMRRDSIAVAITGVAGPTGGSDSKPVGTVCFAFATSRAVAAETRRFRGNRESVRRQSVAHALQGILERG